MGERWDRTDETGRPKRKQRLGRHPHFDDRSLAYRVEQDVAAITTLVSKTWQRRVPPFQQGNIGSCTGNAVAGALGTDPIDEKRVKVDEELAVTIYSEATKLDPWPGQYPPDDTGSSGLAACKATHRLGLISGYRWATSTLGFATLLQHGPVLMGMPWYEAFFRPDKAGFIDADPGWQFSGVAGGHEIEVLGIVLPETGANMDDAVLRCVNSWGTGWGVAGYFQMRMGTYSMLRSSGVDLKQLVL